MMSAAFASTSRPRTRWRNVLVIRSGSVVVPIVTSRVSTAANRDATQLRYRNGVVAANTNSRLGHFIGCGTQGDRRAGRRLARAHRAEDRRHGETDRRRGVVVLRRLRVPVAAIAVEEMGLRLAKGDLAGLGLRRNRHVFSVHPLRLVPSGIADRQRQHVVALEWLGKVDDQTVLIADADVQQPPVSIAAHGTHDQAIGQSQGERAERIRAHAHAEPRAALHPEAIGRECRVDVVVEHVDFCAVILVEERPARGQLGLRRVDRQIAPPGAVKHADVFLVAGVVRVGQRAVLPRADFHQKVAEGRNQRPRVAAEIGQVHAE